MPTEENQLNQFEFSLNVGCSHPGENASEPPYSRTHNILVGFLQQNTSAACLLLQPFMFCFFSMVYFFKYCNAVYTLVHVQII